MDMKTMDMKTNDTPQDAGNQNRRGFLKAGAASIAAGLSAGVIAASASGEVASKENSPAAARAIQDMMPTRNLGKTGFRVGIFGLGGQGALEKANNESLALQMIQRALELGVNIIWERVLREAGTTFLSQPRPKSEPAMPRSKTSTCLSSCWIPITLTHGNCMMLEFRKTLTRFLAKVERWKPWFKRAIRKWCAIWASPGASVPKHLWNASTAFPLTPS